MALNFPDTPTDGEVFITSNRSWTYNSTLSTWSGGNNIPIVDPIKNTLTGNGTLSTFALSGVGSLTNPTALNVAVDGAAQESIVDFTVSGGNITFTSPLPNGSKAVVVYPGNTVQIGQIVPSDGSVSPSKFSNYGDIRTALGSTAFVDGSLITWGSSLSGTHGNLGVGAVGLPLYQAATVAEANEVLQKLVASLSANQVVLPGTGNYFTDLDLPITAGTWEIEVNVFWDGATGSAATYFELEGPPITGLPGTLGAYTNVGSWNTGAAASRAAVSTHSGGITRLAQIGSGHGIVTGTISWPTSTGGTLRLRNNSGASQGLRIGSFIKATQLSP